jgi:hypothetical protein
MLLHCAFHSRSVASQRSNQTLVDSSIKISAERQKYFLRSSRPRTSDIGLNDNKPIQFLDWPALYFVDAKKGELNPVTP